MQVVDDVILWLSRASIAAICLLMLYYGVSGIAQVPAAEADVLKQAFVVAGYVLFILLPLLIFTLALDSAIIHEVFEWGMSTLYVAIVVDIVAVTVLYLVM